MTEKKFYQEPNVIFRTTQVWESIADTCWGYAYARLMFPDSQLLNIKDATEPAIAPYNTSGTWGSDIRDVNFSGGCAGGAPQEVIDQMNDWLADMKNKHDYLGVPYMTIDTIGELQSYFAGGSAFNSIANTQSEYIHVYTQYTPT